MTHRITFIVDTFTDNPGVGLNAFTRNCPTTFHNMGKRALDKAHGEGWQVRAMITEPVEEVNDDYMKPAIARHRHQTDGTENEPRVYYHLPVECQKWMATLLMRQGYEAVEVDQPDDGTDRILRVVTISEAKEARLAALEEELAVLAEAQE